MTESIPLLQLSLDYYSRLRQKKRTTGSEIWFFFTELFCCDGIECLPINLVAQGGYGCGCIIMKPMIMKLKRNLIENKMWKMWNK